MDKPEPGGRSALPAADGGARGIGADFIIPGLAVAVTLYYFGSTWDLTWEARSTGWLVGFVLLVLCLFQVLSMVFARRRGGVDFGLGDLIDNNQNNRRRLGLMLVLCLFVAALPLTGTTLGLFLTIAGCMLIMGVRSPAQVLGLSAATAATVFLLFLVLLKSRLPRGALDEALVALVAGLSR